jgi:hypothetical protein
LVLRRLTPDQAWHPARLQRQVDALHQVLQLIEGRIPELLVGEQRIFVRKQIPPSVGSQATTPDMIPAEQRGTFSPLLAARPGPGRKPSERILVALASKREAHGRVEGSKNGPVWFRRDHKHTGASQTLSAC